MKIYRNVPRELVDGWPTSIERHAGGRQFAFHYHNVEEWLEVLAGDICFVSAGGIEYPLFAGEALRIPRGEAHRVRVGPNGVKYQMWLPVEVRDETFANQLEAEDIALIEKNLAVPKAEDDGESAFFEDFLSEELTFRAAGGKLLDKQAFLKRTPAKITRTPSDSVCVLHKSPDSVLLSTVVHTLAEEGQRQSYSNYRTCVREGERWRLRIWLNYPEAAA